MPKEDTQFKKGHPGGPGRPKGSRNKLCDAFLQVLSDDFLKHGVDVIDRLREEQPHTYVNAIGRLMPKLMEVTGAEGEAIKIETIERRILHGKVDD